MRACERATDKIHHRWIFKSPWRSFLFILHIHSSPSCCFCNIIVDDAPFVSFLFAHRPWHSRCRSNGLRRSVLGETGTLGVLRAGRARILTSWATSREVMSVTPIDTFMRTQNFRKRRKVSLACDVSTRDRNLVHISVETSKQQIIKDYQPNQQRK